MVSSGSEAEVGAGECLSVCVYTHGCLVRLSLTSQGWPEGPGGFWGRILASWLPPWTSWLHESPRKEHQGTTPAPTGTAVINVCFLLHQGYRLEASLLSCCCHIVNWLTGSDGAARIRGSRSGHFSSLPFLFLSLCELCAFTPLCQRRGYKGPWERVRARVWHTCMHTRSHTHTHTHTHTHSPSIRGQGDELRVWKPPYRGGTHVLGCVCLRECGRNAVGSSEWEK